MVTDSSGWLGRAKRWRWAADPSRIVVLIDRDREEKLTRLETAIFHAAEYDRTTDGMVRWLRSRNDGTDDPGREAVLAAVDRLIRIGAIVAGRRSQALDAAYREPVSGSEQP